MTPDNPMYDISLRLSRKHETRYRAARAVSEQTNIKRKAALRILSGDQSPTLVEFRELAEMAKVKVVIELTMEDSHKEVAA